MSIEFDTNYTDEITCPYCGDVQSDSWEFPDDGVHCCDECDNNFSYVRDVSVTYSTSKAEE
jgi:hypothetical protein